MKPITLKDSKSFSEFSFKLIGFLVVVFMVSLVPAIYFRSFGFALFIFLLLALLLGRRKLTVLDPETRSISQRILIYNLPIPYSNKEITAAQIKHLALKFRNENFAKAGYINHTYFTSRFDIKEYYLDLRFQNSKVSLRLGVFTDYQDALNLGLKIAEIWELKFVDYIKVRDEKAAKAKATRLKRGLK